MNNLSHKAISEAIRHYRHISEYLKVPTDEAENQKLIELSRQLRMQLKAKRDPDTLSLLDLVLEHIETYEKETYSFRKMKPVEVLKFLMDQHGLTQSDLKEIGSQSHVSKVLHGTRQLTLEQIIALSKRFHISPITFVNV